MPNFRNKGISTLVGILIILLVIIVLGGGIFVWQKNLPISDLASNQNQNETAGWQTYGNKEYGFEIKYPEDWHDYVDVFSPEMSQIIFSDLSEEQVNDIDAAKELSTSEKENICKNNSIFSIRVAKFNDWLKESREYLEQQGGQREEEKRVVVGNIQGYFVLDRYEDGQGYFTYALFDGEITYLIGSGCPKECSIGWENEKCNVFNQMLSTFKFIK